MSFLKKLIKFLETPFSWQDSKPSAELQLAQEVQKNADEVLLQLRVIKNDLRETVDNKLFTYVEDVVDPIAARIKAASKRLGPEKEEVQAFDQWINKKVKPLMETFSEKISDQRGIEIAVIKHTIEMTAKQIDTDLKVIADDQEHKLRNLNLTDIEKNELAIQTQEGLEKLLEQWQALKIAPSNLSLERLGKWKHAVDQKRNYFYHAAMEIIDRLIPDQQMPEEMHEHIILNFQEIEDLENSIPELLASLEDPINRESNLERLKTRFYQLDSEANKLEQDLRLTPELFDRLQKAKEQLLKAHHYFD